MTAVQKYRHGTFCWADLGTPDPAAASRFYSELFNLQAVDLPMGEGAFYTMLRKDGRDVAAFYRMSEQQAAQGIPPHWLLYVAVDDVDEVARRVEPGGGKLMMPPHDVFDSGRMAMLADPSGAHLALWQARNHVGAGAVGELSAMCWWELASRDAAAAGRFYSELFGWRCEDKDVAGTRYTNFFVGEQTVGGMLQMTPEWGDLPSHWMTYFMVEDCDASAARVGRLGGKVVVEPTDIPPIGRFAVVLDPDGASLSIVQMTPQTAPEGG